MIDARDESLLTRDEMLPMPAQGRVFAIARRAGLGDCAPSGRARLDAIARWLQDVAYGDVEDAGLSDAAVWVLRRTTVDVRRWPRFGERLTVRTFCSGIGRMWAERRTTLAPVADVAGDHDPAPGIVESVALWVHLDRATRMPSVLTEDEIATYGGTGGSRRVRSRLRHPRPDGAVASVPWAFRAADADIADHINNAAYWTVIEEELVGATEIAPLTAEIEFRNPAQPGPVTVMRDGPLVPSGRRWIVSAAGEGDGLHASIAVDVPVA